MREKHAKASEESRLLVESGDSTQPLWHEKTTKTKTAVISVRMGMEKIAVRRLSG